MYYDSTVEYLTEDHNYTTYGSHYYFVFPTVLLLLYPTRNASLAVNLGGGTYALQTFMETFQGQYKDGTNGTRHI